MHRRYINPPVTEASCRLVVDNGEWPNKMDDLWRALAQRYDGIPLMEVPRGTQMSIGDQPAGTLRLRSRDKGLEASFSGATLSIKKGLPYEGWTAFSALLAECVAAYSALFPSTTLKSATVSYENLIVLAPTQDVAQFVPALGGMSALSPFKYKGSYTGADYVDPESGGRVTVNVVNLPGPDAKQVIVRLAVYSHGTELPDGTPLGEYQNPVEQARRIGTAQFEAMISDAARDMFGRRDEE